ncbi:hypothetical protein BJ322DRAFT_238941 [Thelephora terrestris]|uniref:Uncharacterized protein n=1 Tax=Thelephora terrestris TaxID=56493 RepID=A0A9P6L3I6_9AGAM|nr:hypothetical protein BJ322DRAFT_238941 [Thelephora terrestris]
MPPTSTAEEDKYSPGILLTSGLLHSFIQGIITSQVGRYYENYYHLDSLSMKIYVGSIVVVSFAQTTYISYKAWTVILLRGGHSNTTLLKALTAADLFLNGVLCALCHTYLIRRCWKATNNNRWVLWTLSSLNAIVLIAIIIISVAVAVDLNETLGRLVMILLLVWLFGSIVLCFSLTSILLYSLWKFRSGIAHLDKTLSWITRTVLSSALLPSVFIIVAAALNRTYSADPSSARNHPFEQTLSLFFIVITGKVYALSLMHTINSRQAMRERFKSHDHGRTSLSRFQWSEPQTLVDANNPNVPETSTNAVSSGLNQDMPPVRRTASSVTSNYKQAVSPRTVSGEPPLRSVTVNSRLREVDFQEDTGGHECVPLEVFQNSRP